MDISRDVNLSNLQRIRIYISKEFGLPSVEAWIGGVARVSGLRKGYRVVDGRCTSV